MGGFFGAEEKIWIWGLGLGFGGLGFGDGGERGGLVVGFLLGKEIWFWKEMTKGFFGGEEKIWIWGKSEEKGWWGNFSERGF